MSTLSNIDVSKLGEIIPESDGDLRCRVPLPSMVIPSCS